MRHIKKIIILSIIIVIVVTIFIIKITAGYIPLSKSYGDVDSDGSITQKDVDLISRHIKGQTMLKDAAFIAADINADNKVDSKDEDIMKQAVDGKIKIGGGTFYGTDGSGGNSSFDAATPVMDSCSPPHKVYFVAAMNTTDYDSSNISGACIEATGPKGTIKIIITDRLPEGNPGDIDFSESCYHLIANPSDGRVPIYWKVVPADVEGPIKYHFKEGSNPYWTAVQIRNHRYPIKKVEYLTKNGIFKEVNRTYYNYFVEESGMGAGPFTFRVTDTKGHVLIDEGIKHLEKGDVNGKAQFPLNNNSDETTGKPTATITSLTPSRAPTQTPKSTITPKVTVMPTSSTSQGNDKISISYNVVNNWSNGAKISVTLKNKTNVIVNGWKVNWTYDGDQKIVNLWNGNYKQINKEVTVRNLEYNKTIAVNGTVSFGFNISFSKNNNPKNFKINN